MFLSELGFVAGLMAALFFRTSKFHWHMVLVVLAIFGIAVVGAVNEGAPLLANEPGDLGALGVAALVAVGVAALFYAKSLRIGIDELSFITQLAVVWYLFVYVLELTPATLLYGVFISALIVFPLFTKKRFGQLVRVVYFMGHSAMIAVTFFVLVGFSGVFETLHDVPHTIVGAAQSFVVGWTFFYYLVHLMFLLMLMPSKRWGSALRALYENVHGHFHSTQHHIGVLLLSFFGSYAALGFLEVLGVSLAAAIGIVLSVTGFVSHEMRRRAQRQYFFTPAQLRE